MERLTENFKNGQHGMIACGDNCKYGYICGDIGSCKSLDEVIEKLGQYEDLFDNPEKVKKLIEQKKALQKENRKLKKEMLNMMKYAWYNQEDEDEQE